MIPSNVLKTAAQRDSIEHILLLRCWTKIETKAGNRRAVFFFFNIFLYILGEPDLILSEETVELKFLERVTV